jgi:intracellular septation protein
MSETPLPRGDSHWLRAAVDFGGLVAFGLVFFLTHDLLKATWAIVAGSLVSLLVGVIVEKRLAPLPLIMGVFALVFGGLTLVTGNVDYLKMEGSFLYLALGLGLLAGVRLGMNPLRELLGGAFQMDEPSWRTLTIRYALFFLALAVANELIRRFTPNTVWAEFKIAKFVLSLVFSLAQVPFLMKHAHMDDGPKKAPGG